MPKIQMRRDTSANWKTVNPTLLSGEWALETDTKKMKIGDGNTAYNVLEYFRQEDNVWQKPSDWIDMRNSAIPESVYFLVGHSADYNTYPVFKVWAGVSNSGTYDVYVDGVKQATTASGSVTELNWSTLALQSGFDVTTPTALRAHIVRVTPSSLANQLTSIKTQPSGASMYMSGLLWAHFTTTNFINIANFSGEGGQGAKSPVFMSVTCSGPTLRVSVLDNAFAESQSLVNIPILEGNNTSVSMSYMCYQSRALKKVHLKNIRNTGRDSAIFTNCDNLEEVVFENSYLCWTSYLFQGCSKLKKLPDGLYSAIESTGFSYILYKCSNLKDCIVDVSSNTSLKGIQLGGDSANKLNGVKGFTVSSSAPFDHATLIPQLEIKYCGLDRDALVALFNSLPTVTDSQVCDITGCTGASDLTAADLAIATGKGWSVTR